MTPLALPLAVLLSSLITYGNLGEHFELTAVKSLGISLVRSLAPIFVFTLGITYVAFLANNYMVPKAALETYSLLYDIKQKKPGLDLREGAFYNGIPDISIKVAKKFPDGVTLRGVVIYDHRGRNGNKDVTIADSGKMYTIFNEQYLKLELFRGYKYEEGQSQDMTTNTNEETYSKSKFDKSEIVFDLSSFGLIRTDKRWFASNRIMRNLSELGVDMDSVGREVNAQKLNLFNYQPSFFNYHFKRDSLSMPPDLKKYSKDRDSIALVKSKSKDTTTQIPKAMAPPSAGSGGFNPYKAKVPKSFTQKDVKIADSIQSRPQATNEISSALNKARIVKNQLTNYNTNIDTYKHEYRVYQIQWHKILANSIACIAMFLIGAPLGAIIKKGGLGMPVLASILFFILFYVLNITGDKWALSETVPMIVGTWMSNAVLFAIGLVFLRQARVDARLFDSDFYNVIFDRLKQRWKAFRSAKAKAI
jgi:lipopolysaccharide export system permease protein